MKDFDKRLYASWWALRIGVGFGPIIAGVDKYFNKLTDWGMYLSPLAGQRRNVHAYGWSYRSHRWPDCLE
jgi:hypothetical protein